MAEFNFKAAQIKSLKDKVSQLTEEFQKQAKASGWPDKIIQQIRIVVTDDGVAVNYPPNLKPEVDSLEYGEIGVPPKPAIRRFTGRLGEKFGKDVGNEVYLDVVKEYFI